jgi:hypothetical protein
MGTEEQRQALMAIARRATPATCRGVLGQGFQLLAESARAALIPDLSAIIGFFNIILTSSAGQWFSRR